jgi:hypothetical protein
MSSIDFSEYSELVGEGGFDVRTPVAPEDEFFHAIYISGQQRQNATGTTEMPGKLQIRGLKNNLDEVNMIITHIKQVLVKSVQSKDGRGEKLECFSYQNGNPPWKSTSGNLCGKNATDRAVNPFCKDCRSQLIITGIYVDETTGKPFIVNKKPVYVFIRAKGVKYGNVANYLSDLVKRDDLEPIVTPVTPESKAFEKVQVNHKRFVTKITVGKQSTNFGMKDVFELTTAAKLNVEAVKNVLNKAKETMEQFKEKFDWSRGKSGSVDYTSKPADTDQKFDFDSVPQSTQKTEAVQQQEAPKNDFSFEDVDF